MLLSLRARQQQGQTTQREGEMEGEGKKKKIKCIALGLMFLQWEYELYGFAAQNCWCCSKRIGDQWTKMPLPTAVNQQLTRLGAAT